MQPGLLKDVFRCQALDAYPSVCTLRKPFALICAMHKFFWDVDRLQKKKTARKQLNYMPVWQKYLRWDECKYIYIKW